MRSFASITALSLGALVALGPTFALANLHGAQPNVAHKRHAQAAHAELTKKDVSPNPVVEAAAPLISASPPPSRRSCSKKNATSSAAEPTSSAGTGNAGASPKNITTTTPTNTTSPSGSGSNCFPAVGFKMPSDVPDSLDNWWCSTEDEYAFLGFSYEVTACQSSSQLVKEFKDIKENFGGRYVRLYGACDKAGYTDTVVDAAWEAGVGLHQLVWFGFDGGSQWKTREANIVKSMSSNPKAKFVTRLIQMGSEPLFDSVLPEKQLAEQVTSLKTKMQPYGVNVTVSDMIYGFKQNGGSKDVIKAIDSISIHTLPFFYDDATTGSAAWPLVTSDIEWAQKNAPGKRIIMDENGWPAKSYSGVEANSKKAVASVSSEQEYFTVLENQCAFFKKNNIGWMFHIYSDDQEPGYGLYDDNNKLKFKFAPKTEC